MRITSRIGLVAITLALVLAAEAAAAEVVVVVSARNRVSTLTRNQLIGIFLGKSDRFPDGSRALPIDCVEGSARREEFYLKFANKTPAQIKAYWTSIVFTGRGLPPEEAASASEVKRRLAADPSAISYIDKSLLDGSVKMLQIR